VFHVLDTIGRAIFELITLVLVVVWWAHSGRGEVTGRQWCDSKDLNRRDQLFLASTGLMFVFSFGTFYLPGDMFIESQCGTYAQREVAQQAGSTAPEALCRDAVIAQWRRDAWGHFDNWFPVIACMLIAAIIGLRRAGWIPPWAARPVTRFLMFFASLAAVFSVYGVPYVPLGTRAWALWAVCVLTVVNTLAVMRSRPLMRWITA
jgi:hypothetical protein